MKSKNYIFYSNLAGFAGLLSMGLAMDVAFAHDDDDDEGEEEIQFAYAKLLIEHNATDEDTGFQPANP